MVTAYLSTNSSVPTSVGIEFYARPRACEVRERQTFVNILLGRSNTPCLVDSSIYAVVCIVVERANVVNVVFEWPVCDAIVGARPIPTEAMNGVKDASMKEIACIYWLMPVTELRVSKKPAGYNPFWCLTVGNLYNRNRFLKVSHERALQGDGKEEMSPVKSVAISNALRLR